MATTKYRGQQTVIMYAPTIDTAPTIDLSGSSRTIEVQEQGNEIDVSTRDDLIEGGQASLSTPPSRTINLQGLDTTPKASRTWHNIKVGDTGRAAVYPLGSSPSGLPYEIGNVVATNRNYSSPHDNAATYQVQWKVNGAWTEGTT
jgi:hypothetical protein